MTTDHISDERYMQRCLLLASLGRGHVSPNPMVGAVIVYRDRIIGEGYHVRCGEAHAEVNAVRSVRNKEWLKESTLYVSLEPCSHYGKTPPCARLIIEMQIPRVVIGAPDPFEKVSGRGIALLRNAGVEVTVGVLEKECRRLNRFFMTAQEKRRPYVLLKWAQSSDGFLDRKRTADAPPYVISDEVTAALVHKLRAETDAVLVGTNTALLDNPSLTVRRWCGRNPLRLVIDRSLKIPSRFHLLAGPVRTCVFTARPIAGGPDTEYIGLPEGVREPEAILRELAARNIRSVMVEGGSRLLQSFIDSGYWDEIRIECGDRPLSNGISAPGFRGILRESKKYSHSLVLTYDNADPGRLTG